MVSWEDYNNETYLEESTKIPNLKVKYCNNNGCNWNSETAEQDLSYKELLVSFIKKIT